MINEEETDLAPDADEEGDNEALSELAELETHPDNIEPDNVDKEG